MNTQQWCHDGCELLNCFKSEYLPGHIERPALSDLPFSITEQDRLKVQPAHCFLSPCCIHEELPKAYFNESS